MMDIKVDGDGRSALLTITASDRGDSTWVQARLDREDVRRLVESLCRHAGLPEPWDGSPRR